MDSANSARSLWVCWAAPPTLPEAQQIILSFLSPATEEEVRNSFAGAVRSAREESQAVRRAAVNLYITLVAQIGIVKTGNETFRQTISPPGQASPWWYHRVAFKDCEADPLFEWIIAVLTIRKLASENGLNQLVLYSAPQQIVETLSGEFSIEEINTIRPASEVAIGLRGLAARAKYAVIALRQLRAVRRGTMTPKKALDVALLSFWDWSVAWNQAEQRLIDRYFKRLPEELKSEGAAVGWFAWFNPEADPTRRGRPLSGVLDGLRDCNEVVILQRFLRRRDVLKAIVSLKPLRIFLRLKRQKVFLAAFAHAEVNYYPIFRDALLAGFADGGLPHHSLVALATERCVKHYAPHFAFSFLEHFPHARAQYEGVRRAGTGTRCVISQHATYSHEKTFLFLHPVLEFRGEPDGAGTPHADYACAMGKWGRELFLECGYEPESVFLTGSPRYDHVSEPATDEAVSRIDGRDEIQILLVCGLDPAVELEMVDAVCAAAKEIAGIRLNLRNHPFRLIEQEPGFAQYRNKVELTHKSLAADLAGADLILFTYSTVAEEALIAGKPVWQWLTLRANGSALAEVTDIPRFGSVASLRAALQEFKRDRAGFKPAAAARKRVLEQIFYQADGGAARRLAKLCTQDLN